MKNLLLISLLLLIAFSCDDKKPQPEPTPTPSEPSEPKEPTGDKVQLWATLYYKKVVESSSTGIPLRDMNGNVIGPKLDNKTWCLAAIEGTVRVDGATYNYAGTTGSSQADCGRKWRASEKVRWSKTDAKYGLGNKNNPLEPYISLACDQSIYPFGTRIYIPQAKGISYELEGRSYTHDGVFVCHDVGGAISGNHIDVFIGAVDGGLKEALKQNPFPFVHSTSDKTFKAFILKD